MTDNTTTGLPILRNQPMNPVVSSTTVTPLHYDQLFNSFLYIVLVVVVRGMDEEVEYLERQCTGTLIREDLVVTAASCVVFNNSWTADVENVHVIERTEKRIYSALRIFIHPNYFAQNSDISLSHDYAIIIVENILKITHFPGILQTDIKDYNETLFKQGCYVGGYGTSTKGSWKFSYFLIERGTTTFVQDNIHDYDSEYDENIFDLRILCHFKHVIPCEGDLGGPVICHGVLYAIYVTKVHEKYNCLDMYATPFSPVTNVKLWLDHYLKSPENNFQWTKDPLVVLLLCCVVFLSMGGIYYGLIYMLQWVFDPADSIRGARTSAVSHISEEEEDDQVYDKYWKMIESGRRSSWRLYK